MSRLCRRWIQENGPPASVTGGNLAGYPEKIIQFGEGNFLRGFADWMVDILNEKGMFGGRVLVAQPVREHRVSEINAQDGFYTVILRGLQGGTPVESRRLVTCVSRAIGARSHWERLVECFRRPGIRHVISNTTEAGIVYVPEPCRLGVAPAFFPAQLTALLYQRFLAAKGDPSWDMVFLPCELINRNGDTLRRYVLQHAEAWGLGRQFVEWVSHHQYFLNTLVDRIVTGFPAEESEHLFEELGCEDRLMVAGELFHLWVIEGPRRLAEELPFHRAGLNVVWVDDLTPYRTRKVRILNGAHTGCGLAAFLGGLDTVHQMMGDPLFGRFVERLVFDAVLPWTPLPAEEKSGYAMTVLDRLRNPHVRHELLSIALNSTAKWRVRLLPSLLDAHRLTGSLPPAPIVFSLAALIAFYRGERSKPNELAGLRNGKPYPIRDDPPVLDFFANRWGLCAQPEQGRALVESVLGNTSLWGMDLNSIGGLTEGVVGHLHSIQTRGVREALQSLVS